MPRQGDLDLSFLNVTSDDFDAAAHVDTAEWQVELEALKEWFDHIGPTLPPALELQRRLMLAIIQAGVGG